jgi:DNA-binding transcriptional ArsR family regulator
MNEQQVRSFFGPGYRFDDSHNRFGPHVYGRRQRQLSSSISAVTQNAYKRTQIWYNNTYCAYLVRRMASSSLLDPIFSPLRRQVLAALLLAPSRQWYMLELARHIGVSRSSLQRELAALVASEILISHQDGNRVYYQANPDCPILPDLQGLLVKTVGVVEMLRRALAGLQRRIDVAFVYGSFAQAAELVDSDIDLMIVGSIGLSDLAPALRSIQKTTGREVNPVVFSVSEVRKKLERGDHFLTSVADAKKIFLIGAGSDLANTLSPKQDQKSLNFQE